MPQSLDPTIVTLIAYLFAGIFLAVGNRKPKPGTMGQRVKTESELAVETPAVTPYSNGKRQEMVEDRVSRVEERLIDHDRRFERMDNQYARMNDFMLSTTLSLGNISRQLDALVSRPAVTVSETKTEGKTQ